MHRTETLMSAHRKAHPQLSSFCLNHGCANTVGSTIIQANLTVLEIIAEDIKLLCDADCSIFLHFFEKNIYVFYNITITL